MIDFNTMDYLKDGSQKQRDVFRLLTNSGLWNDLFEFSPVLAGTIPIGIDTDESDLDILCCWSDKSLFQKVLQKYSTHPDFRMHEKVIRGFDTVIARFMLDRFSVEVFGQNRPVSRQDAYRHMIAEYLILQERGNAFKRQVIELKMQGMKTEPAFGRLLGLKSNPYEELLTYYEEKNQ